MADRPPVLPDIALSLSLAMVESSDAPLLLLDGQLTVIAASATFCRAFRIDPTTARGQPIYAMGSGEWDSRQLRSLLGSTASGSAEIESYEMDLRVGSKTRQLVLKAHKLDYGDVEHVRLLVTVLDVTDARASVREKDDALRDKAILLQEAQHRIANSLQIIASVLMQSARKVQSEETRTHLRKAHDRVMSVAAVQRQLAASSVEAVQLRPYLTELCASIGASMIQDPEQIALTVISDDTSVDPDISISLGLIATELVINALKHAFPDGRSGAITVEYHAHGPNWTLGVNDDGAGMPKNPTDAKPGLGTSIVEALAKQLSAHVQIAHAHPGTAVSVVHSQIAAVDDKAAELAV